MQLRVLDLPGVDLLGIVRVLETEDVEARLPASAQVHVGPVHVLFHLDVGGSPGYVSENLDVRAALLARSGMVLLCLDGQRAQRREQTPEEGSGLPESPPFTHLFLR